MKAKSRNSENLGAIKINKVALQLKYGIVIISNRLFLTWNKLSTCVEWKRKEKKEREVYVISLRIGRTFQHPAVKHPPQSIASRDVKQ